MFSERKPLVKVLILQFKDAINVLILTHICDCELL
jgi:hypothetical protein